MVLFKKFPQEKEKYPKTPQNALGDVRKYRVLFTVRKTLVSGRVGKSRLRILENYEIWKLQSASLTVMATIRCIDVADSAQFVAEQAELRNLGGRNFAASLLEPCQATLLGKAAVTSPEMTALRPATALRRLPLHLLPNE